jgi:hypothetical protein
VGEWAQNVDGPIFVNEADYEFLGWMTLGRQGWRGPRAPVENGEGNAHSGLVSIFQLAYLMEAGKSSTVRADAAHQLSQQLLLPGYLRHLEGGSLSEDTAIGWKFFRLFLSGTFIARAIVVKGDFVKRFEGFKKAHRIATLSDKYYQTYHINKH